MEKYTIDVLNRLREGESIILTKSETDEVSELIPKLKNLGILHQPTTSKYASNSNGRKKLSKLIELQSWADFLDWLDGQNTESNITNDFSGSTIGQVNQSESLKVEKPKIKQINHPKAKEKKQNAIVSFVLKFWWQILIPLLIGIVLIMIEKGIIDIGT